MGLAVAALAAISVPCAGQPGPAPAPLRALRVATGQIPPFVIKEGDALTGFSVDLWNAIAGRIGVTTSWTEMGLHTQDAQLQAVRNGDADVAISAIVMTPERERLVDFSIPCLDAGLQIASRVEHEDAFGTAAAALLSGPMRRLVVAGLIVVVLLAHVLWLEERRRNPLFQKGYVRGVAEGLWGTVLIIATGEYGDRETPDVIRRLIVVFMWLFGVVLVAQFTATVTSSLTVRQLRSSIRGPADLPGKKIGTIPNSEAARYLERRGLSWVPFTNADDGYALLMRGEVQAIVYEAPTLQYWAAQRGKGVLQVVGPVFWPQKIGIAVATSSPLRKQIDEAMLAMYADGSYEEVRRKWFASE